MRVNFKTFVAAAIGILSLASTPALAQTTINFESESVGSRANGFTVSGVSFSDTLGANLQIYSGSEVVGTRGLLTQGDDTSALRMLFLSLSTDLSLAFGNDELCSPSSCVYNADRAVLDIFNAGTLVGSTFVLFNQNNIADQTIGISGISFDEAVFTFANSSFQAGNLAEVVDNIRFSAVSAVPEPNTWAMMLVGFGAVGAAMRRRRKTLLAA